MATKKDYGIDLFGIDPAPKIPRDTNAILELIGYDNELLSRDLDYLNHHPHEKEITVQWVAAQVKNIFLEIDDRKYDHSAHISDAGKKEKISYLVYKQVNRAKNFKEVFTSLKKKLDTMYFTWDQLESFCGERPAWINVEGTYFLLKSGDHFSVAEIRSFLDFRDGIPHQGLKATIYDLDFDFGPAPDYPGLTVGNGRRFVIRRL